MRARLLLEQLEARVAPTVDFVSMAGSDLNPGTQALPWQTLQHAEESGLQPFDKVEIVAGSYAGFLVDHAWPINQHVTFESADGTNDVLIVAPGPLNTHGALLELLGTPGAPVGHIFFNHLTFSHNAQGDGVYAYQAVAAYWVNCSVDGNAGDGLRAINCTHMVSQTTCWEDNGQNGIESIGVGCLLRTVTQNQDSLVVKGSMCDGNGGDGITIDGGALNPKLVSDIFSGNAAYGIYLGNIAGTLSLTGNVFGGNGLGDHN